MQPTFRTRLMLGTAAIVVLFVGVAAYVFARMVDDYAERQVAQEYVEAERSFATQRRLLFEGLERECREMARSPRLLAMAGIEGIDAATLDDVLRELPSALVAVLDADGTLIAGRGAWAPGARLRHLPDFGRHLERGGAVHVWPHPGGLAVLAIAPLVQAGELLGSLVCGEPVDAAFAERIGSLAGREVALTHGGRLLGAYWQPSEPEADELAELLAIDARSLPPSGRPTALTVASATHDGIAVPLGEGLGVVFLGHDLSAAYALRDRMRLSLLAIGGVLMVIGLYASARIATRLSRPLRRLTDAANRLRVGELGARVGELRADRELTGLARSFDAMADTVQQLVADVREKAERAEAANRAKDGFLTSVSHELRTPLTGIQSTAELLQQFGAEATHEEQAEFLGTIVREAERLAQRITDTLEYAALAGDRATWTAGPVDLQDACEQACRRIATLQHLKHVDVSILCPEPCRMLGDRERIVQAIEHLVRNAWQWSPDDAAVEVSIRAVRGGHVIEVADRGPGLPAHERQLVFDTFSQGGDVLVDKPDGLGIGLKIVAEVAAMHGGSVGYRDRPDGGACFHVLLRTEDRPIDRLQFGAVARLRTSAK